ncbi:uncharacterized protein LOC117550702 [Gymnodraco acuticeps]|uniref:Uncharacterized protein LOC117550702 n=1 Tax=Gymnodraco acuticeps TaxID=8218 RepID=A0A6P8UR99_GYMAC|nr:uncharacterized protein LOC117550702 [Gymnodraco acuticeps]
MTDSASCEPLLEVRQDTDNSLSSPNDNESSSVDDSQENTSSGCSSSSTTSSTKDEEKQKYFTHKLPEQPCFFFIPHKEWRKLRKTQQKRQFKSLHWTNVIAKGIRSVHPHCSFGFKRHSVKMIGSMTKKPLFTCTGYCRFDDCQVKVNVKVESESSLKAVVCFQGGIVRHSLQQLRRRPIRAEERQLIADTLSSKLPRTVYLQSLNKLEETVLQSGCRDEVPTTGVLKTLSWGEREKQRRHENEMVSLQLMSEDVQDKDDQWIQKVILQPKGVMLWSKRTIRLFHDRSKEDIVYLDATGSIVKKAKGESTPFYIYELVVRNPIKGCSPVPVATYVTCEHTTASITYFLGSFITDCQTTWAKNSQKTSYVTL